MLSKLARAKFRVKIKSLATEAKYIRLEERRAGHTLERCCLHEHRVGALRDEARRTFLAYAFARGVPYAAVERGGNPVERKDCPRVAEIVKSLTYRLVTTADITQWLAAAEVNA